jgi:hypothetical protein
MTMTLKQYEVNQNFGKMKHSNPYRNPFVFPMMKNVKWRSLIQMKRIPLILPLLSRLKKE